MYRLITKTLLSSISRGSRASAAKICIGALIASSAASTAFAQEVAVWTSDDEGTLGGSTFTVFGTFVTSPATSFTSPDFGNYPIGTVPAASYGGDTDFSVHFTPPLNNLRVYASRWNGSSQGATYTFNSTPNIVSGFASASLNGDTLSCPDTTDHSGILEFPGQVSILEVNSNSPSTAMQFLNFVLQPDPCAPATIADIYEDNDSCATATVLTTGSYTGLTVSKTDKDHYSFMVPPGQSLNVDALFTTADGDIDLYLRFPDDVNCGTGPNTSALTQGSSTTDNESITWINSTGITTDVVLEVQVWDTPNNPDCNTYDFDVLIENTRPCSLPANDDMFEDNETCATAAALTDGTYTGLTVSKTDKDHFSFCVPPGGALNVDALFTSLEGDLDLYLRLPDDIDCGTGPSTTALAQGSTATDNENISWTNASANTTTVILEVQMWNSPANPDCNTYDLVVLGNNCSPFQIFCDDNNTNCAGMPTLISGQLNGSPGSGLHLEATQGPPNQFGFFLVSAGKTEPGIMISNGSLCLGTGTEPFARYSVQGGIQNSIGQFSSDGSVFNNLTGTATSSGGTGFDVPSVVPFSGVNDPSIMPGSTWHFQLWHRDGCTVQGESNFSNGLTVQF